MKIAISGKGGTGKTTLAAMLAATLSMEGRKVVALDADPDANLAAALGLPPEAHPMPLSEMREMIAERTGSKGDYGAYFRLNPKVDDIPEKYGRRIGNIRLLVLGGVKEGGGGCICPATALVKALLTHLILGQDESIIMDMEAGIEHLGRATAQSMDALVIVVDEGPWSAQTALRIRKLAGQLGMTRLFAVVNRVRPTTDLERIRVSLDGIPIVGTIPQDDRFAEGVVRAGETCDLEPAPILREQRPNIERILGALENALASPKTS